MGPIEQALIYGQEDEDLKSKSFGKVQFIAVGCWEEGGGGGGVF